jgi:argininosuccinate lyase
VHTCLEVLCLCTQALEVNENILDDARYVHLHSVDAVHALVQEGLPFREAYRIVSDRIASGAYLPPATLPRTHLGSAGNLGNDLIRGRFAGLREKFTFDRAQHALAALAAG